MPLLLLLALVAIGITAIALLLHLTGRSQQTVLDAETAQRAWQRHCPGSAIGTTPEGILINAARDAALLLPPNTPVGIPSSDGAPGLVWAFGADTAARSLQGASITPAPAGLRVTFRDFAAPGLTIPLTETERLDWLARLPPGCLSADRSPARANAPGRPSPPGARP